MRSTLSVTPVSGPANAPKKVEDGSILSFRVRSSHFRVTRKPDVPDVSLRRSELTQCASRKTAGVEPARDLSPAGRQEGFRRLISRSLLCFTSGAPYAYAKPSSGLCESCP